MIYFSIVSLLLLLYYNVKVNCYSSRMNSDCTKTLSSTIMGFTPIASTDRTIQIKRSGDLVTDNEYIAGEGLTVHISNTANQYFFDTNQGEFSGSNIACSNKRTTSSGNLLTMPQSGDVTIKVGWATGYGQVRFNSITLSQTYIAGTPTQIPTQPPPTQQPTPSSYTLVTFEVSVKIQGVSSDALSTAAKEDAIKSALVDAIKSALETQGLYPYNLYIESIGNTYTNAKTNANTNL